MKRGSTTFAPWSDDLKSRPDLAVDVARLAEIDALRMQAEQRDRERAGQVREARDAWDRMVDERALDRARQAGFGAEGGDLDRTNVGGSAVWARHLSTSARIALGRQIRETRERAHITRIQLARVMVENTDVGNGTVVQELENGRMPRDRGRVVRVLTALGMDLAVIDGPDET